MAGCSNCQPILEAPATQQIQRVLWIALIANGAMFLLEVTVSWWADSMSMQADAMDFFGDTITYAVTLSVVGSALAWRTRAALLKSAMMAGFGLIVLGGALWRAVSGSTPEPFAMTWVGTLALLVNVSVAALLFRFRGGDANLRSVWLCSRNDAIGNVAVLIAAAGVFVSASRWPDLAVAVLIAAINFRAAAQVLGDSLRELRSPADDRLLHRGV